ncbi:hypothetical protein ACFQ3P_13795 [Paraburkholderia sabiae]|uniref:Uncharacterized protein n=1 Tax=Paraburkholderia sabiae TaxID=273251 RepID=A0ABU9QD50_9BURK|nr:hypothetical protein [Paraburkholderia sabiae]WJZ76172.1 hypothetical protein QEN71_10335 [Paraburkholderia sabiae]CAD6525953.1 hypothetical protein LMG24235_01902 [Paraburkholderia sabiae]
MSRGYDLKQDEVEEIRKRPVEHHKITRDYMGNNPQDFMGKDRKPFEQVRDELDRVLQANRVVAIYPQADETPATYERRLLQKLMPHGTTWPVMASLKKTPDDVYFDHIDEKTKKPVDGMRTTVLREAMQAPERRGELVEIHLKDRAGRDIVEFEGDMSAWMNQFKGPIQVGPFIDENKRRMRIPTIVPGAVT